MKPTADTPKSEPKKEVYTPEGGEPTQSELNEAFLKAMGRA
jgi:hypothetical protein